MRLLTPAPRQAVSAWLDSHRVVGRGYPSAFPGPWRTDRTPYLREPLDAFDDPAVETLVLLFSSQIGKTEFLLGTMLYAYGADPGPGMYVMPTVKLAEEFSKDRLARALKTCETIRAGVAKGRVADDAILNKRVNGFALALAGSESPATLASRPARRLWADEIDKYPASTAEGDPLAQAIQRTASFRRKKICLASTPTVKGASRIEDWYERSDKRQLWAPCPRCTGRFVVEWSTVRWDSGDPSTARIECPLCSGRIEDAERSAMFAAAEWRPSAPFSGIRGYQAWAVVSPWLRLSEIVAEWLEAKKRPETCQTFVNLKLGRSWDTPSEKVETASLLMRREHYAADVPKGAVVLTAGIDTQDDRLEALAIGWGTEEEAWIISRETFFGDPQKNEVWCEVDAFLGREWAREAGGSARIQCAFVDALGHRTNAVYGAVVPRQHRRLYASIGRDGGADGQLVSTPKVLATSQGSVIRYVVDASQAKGLIYSRLKIEDRSGAGVIHFSDRLGDAFFSELTAEQLITERNKYGVPSKKWAMRPGLRRNESLDCFGMALAALRVVCPTPARFAELAAAIEERASGQKAKADDEPRAPRASRTQNWQG